jgi:hypothetical protein
MIARSSLSAFMKFSDDNSFSIDLTSETAKQNLPAIKKIRHKRTTPNDGNQTHDYVEIELHDCLGALDRFLKFHGKYAPTEVHSNVCDHDHYLEMVNAELDAH